MMLRLKSIFFKDIENYKQTKLKLENEYKGKVLSKTQTKKQYREELEDNMQTLKKNITRKLTKVELYFVGISFVVLTGLVTNQLYTSSIVAMKSDVLSWGGFFIGHLFVVFSFVLLILFAKELTKAFISEINVNITYLIIPAILIPLFSQINSGMINLTQGQYTQIGFSSLVVGFLLVKYVILEMIAIQKNVQPILSYVSQEVFYSNDVSLSEL